MLKIINPITGTELEVANQDFSEEMTWKDAKRACDEFGNGWRLPTMDELIVMYEQLHEKGQGNFKDDDYWSSDVFYGNDAHTLDFGSGDNSIVPEGYTVNVRAIRNL